MNRRMRLTAAMLWCVSAAWAVDWTALKPQGYVNDFAGVVDGAGKKQLDAYCAAVEQVTGVRIALVTIASLQHEPIEDVTHAIFRAWNPPDAPLNGKPQQDAVMWLVAIENRRDSMQAGSALAKILTDSAMAAILRQARPALARQQYAQALMAAANEMGTRIAAAQHKTISVRLPRPEKRPPVESISWLLGAGALLLSFWLLRVLGRPARHIRCAGGFGGGETGGW